MRWWGWEERGGRGLRGGKGRGVGRNVWCSMAVQYGSAVRWFSTAVQYGSAVRQCSMAVQYGGSVRRCSTAVQYGSAVQQCSMAVKYGGTVRWYSTGVQYGGAVRRCIQATRAHTSSTKYTQTENTAFSHSPAPQHTQHTPCPVCTRTASRSPRVLYSWLAASWPSAPAPSVTAFPSGLTLN